MAAAYRGRAEHSRIERETSPARAAVVYYLSRNGHLEHPHFMEVPLSSSSGLYLRGVCVCVCVGANEHSSLWYLVPELLCVLLLQMSSTVSMSSEGEPWLVCTPGRPKGKS